MSDFDYVVVGGGSSGCIVAAELSADPEVRVLLLELGDRPETHPETLIVDGYKDAFVNERTMWEKFSIRQPGLGDRSVFVGTGRGLGGSGSINAMVYLRSSRKDFEDWGTPGWTWDEVVDDYAAMEAVLDPRRREPTRFTETCIDAAVESGFRRGEDLNDGDLDDVLGYEWMNYRGEERRSSYVAFLKPALERPNLVVETGARVHRIVFDAERRVRGVEYDIEGSLRTAYVRREAVLCAGAVETPKILMLSGVGPAIDLRRFGIPTRLEHEGVGRNLQDHPNVTLFYRGRKKVDAKYPQLYGFSRANESTDLPGRQPDTCYVFYPARSSLKEMVYRLLPGLVLPPALRGVDAAKGGIRGGVELVFRSRMLQRNVERLYGLVVILGKPKSRGSVRLRSADPATLPAIDPAYFADPEDLETTLHGLKLARKMAASSALQEWGATELFPSKLVKSDDALRSWIRSNAMTTYHFAGTCRMGEDSESVVDSRLRVRGIEGLRVADASVIPVVPVSALNAPSMLVGYRAAKMMLQDASTASAGSS